MTRIEKTIEPRGVPAANQPVMPSIRFAPFAFIRVQSVAYFNELGLPPTVGNFDIQIDGTTIAHFTLNAKQPGTHPHEPGKWKGQSNRTLPGAGQRPDRTRVSACG